MKNGVGTLDPETVDLSNLKVLSIEDILSAKDIAEKEVPVAEWGGKVRIRALTKAVEFQLREESGGTESMDMDLFEMLLFVHGVIEPQFTKEHVELLKQKSSAPFDRVLKEVMDISGLTKEAKERKKSGFPAEA